MARRRQIETVIDYRELRAQMARLGLTYDDLIRLAQEQFGEAPCRETVAGLLSGKEGMKVSTIKRYVGLLGLRPKVVFERIPEGVDSTDQKGALG